MAFKFVNRVSRQTVFYNIKCGLRSYRIQNNNIIVKNGDSRTSPYILIEWTGISLESVEPYVPWLINPWTWCCRLKVLWILYGNWNSICMVEEECVCVIMCMNEKKMYRCIRCGQECLYEILNLSNVWNPIWGLIHWVNVNLRPVHGQYSLHSMKIHSETWTEPLLLVTFSSFAIHIHCAQNNLA